MDNITKETRSRNMSRIKSKNTRPELIVRKELYKRGYRYRIHTTLPGKPDIAFKNHQLIILIHGCFWHGHDRCVDGHIPKTNSEYWKTKIRNNIERDKKNLELLLSMNWRVLVLWECEINTMISKIISEIELRLDDH